VPDTELEPHVTPDLAHFTRIARESPKMRFSSLMGLLSRVQGLRASFDSQPERKAVGVDGVKKADYQEGLALLRHGPRRRGRTVNPVAALMADGTAG